MTVYGGTLVGGSDGPVSGRAPDANGTTHGATVLEPAGSTTTPYPRGGSTAFEVRVVDVVGWLEVRTGDAWGATAPGVAVASLAGWLEHVTGTGHAGRLVLPTAVYRRGDRTTLVGYAVDLAGQRLRQVRIQFIGETSQDLYAGAGTNLDGLMVAYLPTGDTYAAFAYSPATGVAWRLEELEDHGNHVSLRFRRLTRSGGYGEGIFLGAA